MPSDLWRKPHHVRVFAALQLAAEADALALAEYVNLGRSPWRVRLHEAGHAVIGHMLGLPVTGIDTIGGGDVAGITHFEPGTTTDRIRSAVVLWAGPVAENSLLGAERDLAALKAIDGLAVTDDAACPFALALDLVDEYRREIAAVARVLARTPVVGSMPLDALPPVDDGAPVEI